jgi:hypothetical protein
MTNTAITELETDNMNIILNQIREYAGKLGLEYRMENLPNPPAEIIGARPGPGVALTIIEPTPREGTNAAILSVWLELGEQAGSFSMRREGAIQSGALKWADAEALIYPD